MLAQDRYNGEKVRGTYRQSKLQYHGFQRWPDSTLQMKEALPVDSLHRSEVLKSRPPCSSQPSTDAARQAQTEREERKPLPNLPG